jgi:thiosulfate/3-mercaptopyruvate sulfurtransferase
VSEIELDELAVRLGDPALVVLDVRTAAEFEGLAAAPCDPRAGHIPGARHLDVMQLAGLGSLDEVRALVGEPEGAEIVAYCHSGSRSELAAQVLTAAGYVGRNYRGSWHEWSRHDDLPAEQGR